MAGGGAGAFCGAPRTLGAPFWSDDVGTRCAPPNPMPAAVGEGVVNAEGLSRQKLSGLWWKCAWSASQCRTDRAWGEHRRQVLAHRDVVAALSLIRVRILIGRTEAREQVVHRRGAARLGGRCCCCCPVSGMV
eukprot:scaffold2377_cov376-Prasinococcus_capsulatus_cf.AAC.10